jgi:hypothetical protein
MARLKEIATVVFTFSIDELYSNPIQFLFSEDYTHSEEVEENIALNMLGTIIHETLKVLYEPFIGKIHL